MSGERAYTASEVCRALATDQDPESGWMRQHGQTVEPRTELWLQDTDMWVRSRGHLVTGWKGARYLVQFFGPISAWRIRRAVRRWHARHHLQGTDRNG